MKNILIINPIIYTAETNEIPTVKSIQDTMIYTLCMGFLKAGHQVTLIAAEDYKPCEEEVYPFPVVWMHTVCHRVFQPRCFPYMPELRAFLRKHQEYDLIITSEMFATWSYTAVRLYPDKTVVWHELAAHNRMLHQIPSGLWYNVIARFLMSKAHVIARSRAARNFISQFVRCVAEETIDHGVELEKLPQAGITPEDISKQKQFVVVSQLIERKQINKTIEAFADFVERGNDDYNLFVIGQGEEEAPLRQVATDRNMGDKVKFCGQMTHERLLPIVAESQALLVYTRKDNNMVSIVESIAVGTPVVTTPVPYNAEYIRRENLGIVQDQWDADALEQICIESQMYVQNCLRYRRQLSNVYCAESFLRLTGTIEDGDEG